MCPSWKPRGLPRFECHTSGKIGPTDGIRAYPWPVIVFCFWKDGGKYHKGSWNMTPWHQPQAIQVWFWRKIPQSYYRFAWFDAPNIDPVPGEMMKKWISFELGELEVDLTGWKSPLCFYGFCLFYIFLDMLQLQRRQNSRNIRYTYCSAKHETAN